jgi:hypothetical protein
MVPVGLGKTGWKGVGVDCMAGWKGVGVELAPVFAGSIGEEEAMFTFAQAAKIGLSRSNAIRMMKPGLVVDDIVRGWM